VQISQIDQLLAVFEASLETLSQAWV